MAIFWAVIIIILLFAFCYYQNNKLDITEYNIASNEIKSPVKGVLLSDFHSSPKLQVIKKLLKINPDIIFITGDFINDHAKNKEKMLEYAKELCKIAPVYYVTGNHERRLEEFVEIMNSLKECGFNVLMNETECTIINGNSFVILGLDENQAGFEDYKARKNGTFIYKNMTSYFDKFLKKDGFKVVLSHYPENFELVKEMNYSQYDFDLQLSGHAHGGQFILPFIGPVLAPGQGLFPKYARGEHGTKPKLIISRGIGNSEFPLRLFNHPEIVVINITDKQNRLSG